MAKTYIQLVNEVLRDVNEVPIISSDFPTARGVQDFVKKAINRAYMDIVGSSQEWPWLTNTGGTNRFQQVSTVAETQWYALGQSHNIDLNVVLLKGDDTTVLTYVSYDLWAKSSKVNDDSGKPTSIFKHPTNDLYGLSPTPDIVYTLEFSMWDPATEFVNDVDVMPFADQYYTVLINRALFYVWMWRENLDHANMVDKTYDEGLKEMKRHLLSSKIDRMRAI